MLETQGLSESLESGWEFWAPGSPPQIKSNQILGRHFKNPAIKSNSYVNTIQSTKGQAKKIL